MPKFKQTRQKETPGFSMSSLTETRVIEADTEPGGLYIVTETVGNASQTYDWRDNPLPVAEEAVKTPEKDKG